MLLSRKQCCAGRKLPSHAEIVRANNAMTRPAIKSNGDAESLAREQALEGREAAGYRDSEGGVSSREIAPEPSASSVIWRPSETF
jgi:hypothetical protein